MDVIPRGLADDLTVVAIGPGHERRSRDAYATTISYLFHLGAKPAPNKCFTFSSCAETRFRLSDYYWQGLQAKVRVTTEARDLGGHLSVSKQLKGATQQQRLRRATALACKLACFPWGWEARQKVVNTLMFPMAIYGCEAGPLGDGELAKLDTAIARATGPYSHNLFDGIGWAFKCSEDESQYHLCGPLPHSQPL